MPRSLDFEYLLTPNGLEHRRRVHMDDAGRIRSIEAAGEDGFDARFAIPGMPNAHSHVFQRAMAGFAEAKAGDDTFWSWRRHMYRLAAVLTPDDLYAIARRAYADMLAAGFTSVAEFHYIHHSPDDETSGRMGRAVTEAARDAGIRQVFLPVYYRQGGFGKAASAEQGRFLHPTPESFGEFLSQFTDVTCGIAPHSLRAVPAAELGRLVEVAESVLGKSFPIHMHVAEQLPEVSECQKHHGARPVTVLANSVDLDSRWNIVHATHADEDERALIINSGARVVLCPLTEAYLGDGLFEAGAYMRGGGQWGIGSDSNVRIDAIEELRVLEYGQRLARRQRACLADASGLGLPLWQHAAGGGAEALQIDAGVVQPGRFADFVTLDLAAPALAGVAPDRVMDAWVTAGSRQDIAAVYVGGKMLAGPAGISGASDVASDYSRVMKSVNERMRAL